MKKIELQPEDNIFIEDQLKHIFKFNLKITETKKQIITSFFEKDVVFYFNSFLKIEEAINNNIIDYSEGALQGIKANEFFFKKATFFEKIINNESLILKIKNIFKTLGAKWLIQSKIAQEALSNKMGGIANFRFLEHVYNNKPLSDKFGFVADQIILNNRFLKSARVRNKKIKPILQSYIKKHSDDLRILNLACGSCREVRELLFEIDENLNKKIIFTLLDKDKEALSFSKKKLPDKKNIKYQFINTDIFNYLKNKNFTYSFEKEQNLIYILGLAEYCSNSDFKKIIKFCFKLLKKNGRIILTYHDIKNHPPSFLYWWTDLNHVARDKKDIESLIKKCNLKKYYLNYYKEKQTNIVMFFTITKK